MDGRGLACTLAAALLVLLAGCIGSSSDDEADPATEPASAEEQAQQEPQPWTLAEEATIGWLLGVGDREELGQEVGLAECYALAFPVPSGTEEATIAIDAAAVSTEPGAGTYRVVLDRPGVDDSYGPLTDAWKLTVEEPSSGRWGITLAPFVLTVNQMWTVELTLDGESTQAQQLAASWDGFECMDG